MKKNKKKITKYLVGTLAVSAISAAVISAAVGCSSVNSTSTTTNSSTKSASTNAVSTTLTLKGITNNEGTNYNEPFNKSITLSANNSNLPTGNVTYSWYCNKTLLAKQTTSSTYSLKVSQTKNTYYVVTYVNNQQVATSNSITISPTFTQSEFSATIYADTGSNGTMQPVSLIDDVTNTSSYKLAYHLFYDGQEFTADNLVVNWAINNQTQSNNNSSTIIVNNLQMGTNQISATDTVTVNNQEFTINATSLIINNAMLSISGTNVENNAVNVNYDGSLTLSPINGSIASLNAAGIQKITYQWYEIKTGQQQSTALASQTQKTLVQNNLVDNATYYLVASWQDGKTTHLLTSNKITVNVNNVPMLVNPSIVCNYNYTDIKGPLNLASSNINNDYKFSINANNLSTVSGKVTYTLKNLTTKQTTTFNESLTQTLTINFKTLGLVAGDKYQLSATITTPNANGQTITYNSSTYKALTYDVNYSNLTITLTSNATDNIREINSNSYNVNAGSSVTLKANNNNVFISGKINYQWRKSSNGTSWIDLNTTNNLEINDGTLTIDSVGNEEIYYQLQETINNITINSNTIKIIPVVANTINSVTISASNGTLNNGILSISENYQNLELSANVSCTDKNAILNYQWFKQVPGASTWTNITGATKQSYDIPSTGDSEVNYKVQVTSGTAIVDSQVITIDPQLTSNPTATISGNQDVYYDTSAINNGNSDTLSITIMNANQEQLTSADYNNLNVAWKLNDNAVPSSDVSDNGLTLNLVNELNPGANQVSATISFTIGSNTYNINKTYTINFYQLTLSTAKTSQDSNATVAYGDNANTVNIYTGGYIYASPSYQWQYLIGSAWKNIGPSSSTTPTSLPSDTLYASTKFRLVVTTTGNSTNIISQQTISVTVPNPDITGQITTTGVSGNVDYVYGTNPIKLNFSLLENNSTDNNIPSGTTYSWSYSIPNRTTVTTVANANSTSWDFENILNGTGTYTITATANLPGAINVSATFKIIYTKIAISTTKPAYYGYDVTLQTNISNAKSYAWYLVTNGTKAATACSVQPTYTINGITANQEYEVEITSPNGITYSSTTYQVTVNKLSNLSLTTSYNEQGYANWWVNEELTTFIGQAGFNNFINQNGIGYAIASNITYQDFTNYKCYFQAMPSADGLGNQQFLTISAVATKPIDIATWSSGWQTDASLQVPSGSLFTWTLPYELSSLYYGTATNGKMSVGLKMLNSAAWLTADYSPSLSIPFGLSIGNSSNPTAISGNGKYVKAINGVIGIAYANSAGDSWTAPADWWNAYPGTTAIGSATTFANANNNANEPSIVLTNESNSANINRNQLITFLTSASTTAGPVSPSSFTNDGMTITPTSCTYSISNGTTTIISDATANWIDDQAMVNYEFNEPGKYEITITYTIPNLDNTTLVKSESYFVNYNQASINVSNSNPALGLNVNLTANNSEIYESTSDASYQWQQYTNGSWSNVGANKTSYQVKVNQYGATYEYRLKETIGNLTYTSDPVTLTPNVTNFKASATITNTNAVNGDIDTSSNNPQTFNLSVNCNGVTYNASNNSSLSNVNITWTQNGTSFGSSSWTSTFSVPTSEYGTYQISATITFTLYGYTFKQITTNVITLDYVSAKGNLAVATATSTSPYIYNNSESKLVIWGNGTATDNNQITFNVTDLNYDANSTYAVEFTNGTSSQITSINYKGSGSSGTFSLPVSAFEGYTGIQLLVNKMPESQKIAYTYLPTKPWFEIKPSSTFNLLNPQIILVPNEDLGNATLGALTASDISFSLNVNGTTIDISPKGNDGTATITIDGQSIIRKNFFVLTNGNVVSVENNVTYKINNQSITGQAYVINFDSSEFQWILSIANSSGIWTTVQVNTTLSGVTLDNEPISGQNPLTQIIGYANSNNSTSEKYTAGIYRNGIPVTSVPEGATGVTLQVSNITSSDQVQWVQVTNNGNVDLTNGNSVQPVSLNSEDFLNPGQQLTYKAIITTANGQTITTNSCTVTVTNLGQATINVKGVSENGNNTYSLTYGNTYNIQTTDQTGVTLNDSNGGTTYYQWQYKSNSLILGNDATSSDAWKTLDNTNSNLASNGTWTNLGNATTTYNPYQYQALPMYSVSFRLVVFNVPSGASAPTSFNPQTNTQYIISNTVNTYTPFNGSFSLAAANSSIKEGDSATFTLNPSDQDQIISILEHSGYQYYTTQTPVPASSYFYPMTVTWYYKLSSSSSWTTAMTLSVELNNGHLQYVAQQTQTDPDNWEWYQNSSSLSFTFDSSCFSTSGSYDVYAQVNFTDNFTSYNTSTYSLTVTGSSNSTNNLNYKYSTYIEDAITNWALSNKGVENTSLSGYQTQTISSSNTTAYTTFNDLIQQNTQGVKILNSYQDFDDIKVSFTQMPSSDASALGSYANDYWLTISATSSATIDLTTWQGNDWGTNTVETVQPGYVFVWTLPYTESSITLNGNILEMPINQTALNDQNTTDGNYGTGTALTIPFGLTIGTTSDPTSVSSTWNSNIVTQYSGHIATNFGTGHDLFALPSPWVFAYNKDQAFAYLFASQLSSNAANFGGTDESASNFFTSMINGNQAGFAIPGATYSDFSNWYVSYTTIQSYDFLTISAYSNSAITMDYWDNGANKWANLQTIPSGSYFTWTLPYNKANLTYDVSAATLSNPGVSQATYFDPNDGAPLSSWTTPLGLTIGTLSDPTSITSGSDYTTASEVKASGDTTHNGVIGWNYGSTTTALTFDVPVQSTTSSSYVLPKMINQNK